MTIRKLENNKITILIGIIVIVFVSLLCWLLHNQPEHTDQQQNSKLIEFQGSKLEEKQNGKLIWSLTAEKVQIDPDTNIIYVTHPQVILEDVDGQQMTIDADNGVVDRDKRTMEVKPPIRVKTDTNSTLQTDGSVYYNMDTRVINGGKVLIQKSDGTELSGDSFETNAALDNVTLTGHAKVAKGE